MWFVYAPLCISTLATIKRETSSWKKMLYAMIYLFALAYAASTVTCQHAEKQVGAPHGRELLPPILSEKARAQGALLQQV